MGYQDREWYRDHARRHGAAKDATYQPKMFRRRDATKGPQQSPRSRLSQPASKRRMTTVCILVAALAFVGTAALLNHRKAARRGDSVLASGMSAGGLRIVSRTPSATSVIELRQINGRGAETGFVWIIVAPPGTSEDRMVPVGTYHARFLHRSWWGDTTLLELKPPVRIVPVAEQLLSGTLTF